MTAPAFALAFGIAYLAAGVLGFVPAALEPLPADAPATTFTLLYGELLGLFPVNIVHSVFHLAIGFWGIAAWSGAASAVGYARSSALLFGLLAVLGLIPGANTVLGLVPLHGNGVWLHGLTALAGAWSGWRRGALETERRHGDIDRRSRALGVALDRRSGLPDRRGGYIPT